VHTNMDINNIYFEFARRLFSAYNILQLPSELSNNLLNLSIEHGLDISNYDNIRNVYNEIINKYYHNEITIKSNFINNVLLKSTNHITIFEFNLESSRADLCKINGKSIAFEIKTDLDNFSRLKKQIRDYSEVFEEVYVICSKENLCNVLDILPQFCGVYTYTILPNSYYKFVIERVSLPCNNLNNFKQLSLLTKKELKDNFSKVNYIDDKETIINKVITTYSSRYINSKFKKTIKERYKEKWEFLRVNSSQIYEIDYQWFFKNNINPKIIYQ
jgi:hypothetical protein